MSNTEEKAWERSFQTGPRLTPEEAHRVVVLRQRLSGLRYLSSEYLLRRATLSRTKQERIAWESVWALVVFVEHHKRFPRQGELYPYLHKTLDESKVLEDLKLPEIDSLDLRVTEEAHKGTLESLVATELELRSQLRASDQFLFEYESTLEKLVSGEAVLLAGQGNVSDRPGFSAYLQKNRDELAKLRALRGNLLSRR